MAEEQKGKDKDEPTILASRPVWKNDSKTGVLGIWELLRGEYLDFLMPVETRSPNRVCYSELVDILKNDYKFCEFHESTDRWLIDQEYREYFNETYHITNIYPLLMDHSGTTIFFLDDHSILFA
ncbi:unnamed protein product [Rhizophagus irregularis]|nr:unnamed protein product [Rhizophagus irregularis]